MQVDLPARLALCVAFATGCAGDPATDLPGGAADEAGHSLPGFEEALLVGGLEGELAVIHVGDAFDRAEVDLPAGINPHVIRSRGGKFFALFASKLAVIDAATGEVDDTIALPASPGDIEWATEDDDSTVYVSLAANEKVIKLDLATGDEIAAIDLSSLAAGATIELRRMARVGDRLFVQVARRKAGKEKNGALAVIDTARDELAQTIELGCLEPDFDMVHDSQRGHLYVTCAGVRPINTGALVRIDTSTAKIHDTTPAGAGFQGMVAFGEPFDILYELFHTSTPTDSSHLFARPVSDDGKIGESERGALIDAFDGNDAIALNAEGTLLTMANHCLVGFCIGGAGLNFVDAASSELFDKLLKDQLGFEPVIVQFGR